MIKRFIYDVKLVIQHTKNGTLDFISQSFEAEVEIGEHDYYIPFVVSNDNVKVEMQKALEEYAKTNMYDIADLYVVTTEVSTNDDMIDIYFSGNETDNSYERDPDVSVEFIPQSYRPMTPQLFRGYDELDAILWKWENVSNCAFRMYDQDNNIVAEMGTDVLSYYETDIIRGENYVRKLVAFNADGESDPTPYVTVSLSKEEYDETLITENRFGYIDVTPIEEVPVQIETSDAFKSGIGDNLDLYTQADTHTVYESFEFDAIVTGEIIEKREHYTAIPVEYKIMAEGTKEKDGPIDSIVDVSIKPWPISTVVYNMESYIKDECPLYYQIGVDVTFQKKRPTVSGSGGISVGTGGSGGSGSGSGSGNGTPGNPSGTPTYPGGNWVGGIGTDEFHDWEINIGGEIFSPGQIDWGVIQGPGSIIINPNGTITGGNPGNVVIEGTLPNGDKIIIEAEVLPPIIDMPTADKPVIDSNGNPLPPIIPAIPGTSGDGGGVGGGIIPTPDQEAQFPTEPIYPPDTPGLPPDYHQGHCPCIYLYETTTIPLRLTSGSMLMNHLFLELDHHKEPPEFDNSTVPPTYIRGCLCCLESDDLSSVNVIKEVTIDEETHEEVVQYYLKGEHVGRSHFRATYKGVPFHFNVHVVKLNMWIEPLNHLMRVGEQVSYSLYKSPLLASNNNVLVDNAEIEWSIDNYCTIKPNAVATGERHGKYNVYAKHLGRTITEKGEIVPPTIVVDYSTSATNEYGNEVYVAKLDRKIKARILVNDQVINNKELKFTMQDTGVATINEEGYIFGNSLGSTTLTISYKGYTVNANVKIIDRVIRVLPSKEALPNDFEIFSEDKRQIEVFDESSKVYHDKLVFRSLNSTIATVDSAGYVTGKTPGDAIIQVVYRGYVYDVKVRVLQSTLRIEPAIIDVKTESNVLFRVFKNGILVEDAINSTTDSVARASVSGRVVTGKTVGETILRVSYYGLNAEAQINVTLNPSHGYTIGVVNSKSVPSNTQPGGVFALYKNSQIVTDGNFKWSILDEGIGYVIDGTNNKVNVNLVATDSYVSPDVLKPPKGSKQRGSIYIQCEYSNDMYTGIKLIREYKISKERLYFMGENFSLNTLNSSTPVEITLYTSNIDNKNRLTEAILSIHDYYTSNNAIVHPSSCDIEIFDNTLIDVIEDGNNLKIIPKLSGETYIRVSRPDDEEIVKVVIKDILSIDISSVTSVDMMKKYYFPLYVNGVEAEADTYELSTEEWYREDNEKEIYMVCRNASRTVISYTYRGQIVRSEALVVNNPVAKLVILDGTKLPDMYNPQTKTNYPDAYKLTLNKTYNFEFYINDVLVRKEQIITTANNTVHVAYDNAVTWTPKDFTLQTIANGIIANIIGINGAYAKIYCQVGEMKIKQALTNMSYNSECTVALSIGDTVMLPIKKIKQLNSIISYRIWEPIWLPKDGTICGAACYKEDNGSSLPIVKFLQGGIPNKLIGIYKIQIPSLEPNDYEDDIKVYHQNEERPFIIECEDEILNEYPDGEISKNFYKATLSEGDTIYNFNNYIENRAYTHIYPVYQSWVNTYNIKYMVVAPLTRDNKAGFKGRYITDVLTEPAKNIIIDGEFRVGGIKTNVKIDFRYYADLAQYVFTSIGGCHSVSEKCNVDATLYTDMRDRFNIVTKEGEIKNYSFREDMYTYDVDYQSPLYSYGGHSHETKKKASYGSQKKFPLANTVVKEGVNELTPNFESYDKGVAQKYYAYGYVDTEPKISELLDSAMSTILLNNTKNDPKLTYKYGEVNKKEIKYSNDTSGVTTFASNEGNLVITTNKTKHVDITIEYRNLLITKPTFVLYSNTPNLVVDVITKMNMYQSITPTTSVDGITEILSFPAFRYLTIVSDNPSVIEVSKFNVLTAKSEGTAKLTFQFANSIVEKTITVTKNSGLLCPTGNIIGPMQEITLYCYNDNMEKMELDAPEWSVSNTTNSRVTSFGSSAKFIAGQYGTYKVYVSYNTISDTGTTIRTSKTFTVEVTTVSSINTVITTAATSLMSLSEPSTKTKSISSRKVQSVKGNRLMIRSFNSKLYTPSLVPGYFLKNKYLTYTKNEILVDSLNGRKELDALAFAKSDSEIALSPPDTIVINNVELLNCNIAHARFNISLSEVFLHLDLSNNKYSCDKSGTVGISIKDGRYKPLFNVDALVYVNPIGEIYKGSKLPTSEFTYQYVDGEVTLLDGNGNNFPSKIVNSKPHLMLGLANPQHFKQEISLNDAVPKKHMIVKNMFDQPLENKKYIFEILINDVHNTSFTTFDDTRIAYGKSILLEKIVSDKTMFDVTGNASILLVPYNEESEILSGIVNGKKPMINNLDGLRPLITIAPAFDLVGQRVREAIFKVQLLNSNGKHITATFASQTSSGVTKVNGDRLTFTSTETELVDVTSRITCTVARSKTFEITSHNKERMKSHIYNPLHDSRLSLMNIKDLKVSASSKNPNVLVYPVIQDVTFGAGEAFSKEWEFEAFILSPSQSCWSPVIHPGYYYINNDEYFLYKSNRPYTGYGMKEVPVEKEFYVSIEATTQKKDKYILVRNTFDMIAGTHNGTIVNNGSIILAPISDTGVYESEEMFFAEPLEEVECKVYGELLDTFIEISIKSNGVWEEYIPYINCKSIFANEYEIEGLKVRCNLNRRFDGMTPTLTKIGIKGSKQKWIVDDIVKKSMVCKCKLNQQQNVVTKRTLLDIMTRELQASGKKDRRIISIVVNSLDKGFTLNYSNDGSTELMATSHSTQMITVDANYINFDEDGFAMLSPIPRLGRPVIVKKGDTYLRHLTEFDQDGELTHIQTDTVIFNGVLAMALAYYDIDQLVVTSNDQIIPIKTIVNNMVYFEPTVKLSIGAEITATYCVKNSFFVDYNKDIENNMSLLSVYLSADDKEYTDIEVFYETNDVNDYFASEIEINPLYNTLNSGFIYIAADVNTPSKINLHSSQREFVQDAYEHTYIFAQVVDKLGNTVPYAEVTASANKGVVVLEKDETNQLGVLAIKYVPPTNFVGEDIVTVSCDNFDVTSQIQFTIREQESPKFLVVKPSDNVFEVPYGKAVIISVDMYQDGLIPCIGEPVRLMVKDRAETVVTKTTDGNGNCKITITPIVNIGYDICRLEITSGDIVEYLDLKVVI